VGLLALGGGLLAGLVAWTMAGMGIAAPLRALPPGDVQVRRLMDGILRRVRHIGERVRVSTPAQRPLMDELAASARRLEAAAQELADGAAGIPDPLVEAAAASLSLPAQAAATRDATVSRLLEIAGALDETLAALGPLGGAPSAPVSTLARLREETSFAEAALPALAAARLEVQPEPAKPGVRVKA
jgi:hypothetical protein